MVKVMEQTVAELAAEGIDYRGCLYGGFMLTPAGPKVLEFNARFGDPETQVVLPRLKNDLVEVMLACANCELDQIELDWRDEWAVAVVLTSAGYPGSYEKGKVITGIADAEAMENVTVYHAGTRRGGRSARDQRRPRACRDRSGRHVRERSQPCLRGLRED